jgi:hypothetical protein
MLKRVIFQELHVVGGDIIQLIPFVNAFNAFKSPLFYNHHNRDGDVTIIPSAMGTHEGDPFGGALFVLIHRRALPFTTSHFPFCLFPSITINIHIIGPFSIVSFTYEHFFDCDNLSIQFLKCVAWSPFYLPFDFNTPS